MEGKEQMQDDSGVVTFKTFFEKYPLLTFEKGERVIRPQEIVSNVFCLKSGLLRVYASSTEGKEVTVAVLNAASDCSMIVGFAGILDRYSVEALSPAEVWRSPKKEFADFLRENPSLAIDMSRTLVYIVKSLYHQIELLISGNALERVSYVLCLLGKYEGKVVGDSIRIHVKLTHQLLADLTNLSRETVTSQINILVKQNLIEYSDSTLVIKSRALFRQQSFACVDLI